MKIYSLYVLPMLLFVLTGSITASSKKKKNNQPQQQQIAYGPAADQRACPPCTNFVCPSCTATGSTGSSGCTGPNCTGPCVSPTGAIIPMVLPCINVSQNGTIPAITAGCEQVNGNLLVNLNADIKSDLIVETDLQGNNSCMAGNLNVDGDATIIGNQVILGSLTVNQGATINVELVENGNQTLNGSLVVSGSGTINGTLTVGSTGTFAGPVSASGLSVSAGEVIYNGGLSILNSGCTAISGCTGATINGDVCINGPLDIIGNLEVTSELTVDENTILNNATVGFSGPSGASSNLITNSNVIMNDGLVIQSGDEIINAGSLIVSSGNFTVSGPTGSSNFKGLVTANSGAIFSNGLTVNGGSNITLGDLDVSTGDANINGSLTVNGPISSSGAAIFSDLTITDSRNSIGQSGPAALIDNGGASIAQDLWIGGSEYFANTTTGGAGIPSAFNYYEEACFSTAFLWGGLPATPTENVMIRVIRVGNIVNILIPAIVINNPGAHIDVITSNVALPARFRPFVTVRGAAATIITNTPSTNPAVFGRLGEFNVAPSGIITIGLPGNALGPQRMSSTDYVQSDINTITYNINGCNRTCKRPI